MRRMTIIASMWASCTGLLSFGANAAALSVFGQITLRGNASVQESYSFDKPSLTDPAAAVLDELRLGGQGSGYVTGSADFGVLKTAGRAVVDLDPFGQARSTVGTTTSWSDRLSISSDQLTGTGFAAIRILLDGLTGSTAASSNFGTYQLLDANLALRFGKYIFDANSRAINVAGGGSFTQTAVGRYPNADGSFVRQIDTTDESIFRAYDLLIPITFGTYSNLFVSLGGNAEIAAGASDQEGGGEAWYDLGNSLYWGGISYLLDGAGNRILDFSVVSDSGANYAKSYVPATNQVPEPSSLLLMALGMSLALLVRQVKPLLISSRPILHQS